MKIGLKILLFLLSLVAGVLAVAVLLDAMEMSDAQEIGMRVGAAVGVGYLVVMSGYFLFQK